MGRQTPPIPGLQHGTTDASSVPCSGSQSSRPQGHQGVGSVSPSLSPFCITPARPPGMILGHVLHLSPSFPGNPACVPRVNSRGEKPGFFSLHAVLGLSLSLKNFCDRKVDDSCSKTLGPSRISRTACSPPPGHLTCLTAQVWAGSATAFRQVPAMRIRPVRTVLRELLICPLLALPSPPRTNVSRMVGYRALGPCFPADTPSKRQQTG